MLLISNFLRVNVGEADHYCFIVHREILQEIQRLRQQHDEASQPLADKSQQNPTLLAELRLLRYRKINK